MARPTRITAGAVEGEKMKAKCINCGAVMYDNDRVYQVRTVDGGGFTDYSPTCSKECAQRVQMKYSDIHRNRLRNMENQSFQIMAVNDFPGACD